MEDCCWMLFVSFFGWLKGTFYRKRSRNGLTTTHLPFNSGIVQVHHSAHDKWPENMFYTFLYSVWIFLLWGWNIPTHVLKLGTTSTWNYLMGPWGTKPPHKVRSCHLGNRPSNQARKSRSLLRPRKIDCQMSKPCHFFVAALSFSKAGILCCTPPASFCINEPRASFKGGPAQTPKTGVFFASTNIFFAARAIIVQLIIQSIGEQGRLEKLAFQSNDRRKSCFETTENVLVYCFETSTKLIQNDQNISKLYTYNILLDIATNPNVQGPIVW